MRRLPLLVFVFVFVSSSFVAQTDNGCKLKFLGKDSARKAVKLRPTTKNYRKYNDGDPLSVKEFLNPLCFDVSKKVFKKVPTGAAMPIEEQTITLHAFVLAMKHDDNDNDLHIQVGDKPKPFNQPQVIVEIPPTNKFCDARTAMMNLFRADGGQGDPKDYFFKNPPEVEITGYLFLDSHHGLTCTGDGGRGIRKKVKGKPAPKRSPVRTTWELHPVIRLVKTN
ncbi:MAG TPA: hypothetical protein VKB05_16255 [Pyrinomonadaceae bacterium]|nr:hypothetical protein [Pyrinomonadaceae bacterium]